MRYGHPSTVESQGRGPLHIHTLLFRDLPMQYMQSEGQGRTEDASEDRADEDEVHQLPYTGEKENDLSRDVVTAPN